MNSRLEFSTGTLDFRSGETKSLSQGMSLVFLNLEALRTAKEG